MAAEHMTEQESQAELLQFDPLVVIRSVLRRWYLIVVLAILAAQGAYTAAEITYQPEYTCSTTFVVTMQGSSSSVFQNLSAASTLATTFSSVLNSSILRTTVLNSLDMRTFDGKISAAVVDETNLLTMQVTASDPRTAFLVSKAVIEHHSEVSYQVMGDIILEVLQQPRVPVAPSNPMRAASQAKKAALVTAVAVCALLAVTAVLRDTVRSSWEIRQKLDCRVLAEIRHERKYKTFLSWLRHRKAGILMNDPVTSFSYTETIRSLRRKVEQHTPEGGKVLMVTSALENEGKSTVAVNLALAFAQKQQRVLLIDGDLRKPACHKIMGCRKWRATTTDVLRGAVPLEEAVVGYVRSPALQLLMERRSSPNAAELAAGEGMAQLIAQAREQYDVVILDTPPMAAGPDTECMMELCDASLLVIRQDQARTKALLNALDVLQEAHASLLGCVLNDCYLSILSEQGNYGYGSGRYGYSSGYGQYGKYGKYGKYGQYAAADARQAQSEQKMHEQ